MQQIITLEFGETLSIGEVSMLLLPAGFTKRNVNFGITAPPHIAIHRHEIYARIQADKLALAEN